MRIWYQMQTMNHCGPWMWTLMARELRKAGLITVSDEPRTVKSANEG